MCNFDNEITELITEYFKVEAGIKDAQKIKRQCDEEIKTGNSYIGELKGKISDMMTEDGLMKTETEFHTITKKATPSKVIIDDEKALQKKYLRIKTEPDKALIKAMLKKGTTIIGAKLSNGGDTIQITTKKG